VATELLMNVATNRKVVPGYAVIAITDKMRKSKWSEIVGLMPEKTKRVRKVPQTIKGAPNPFYTTIKTRFPEIPEAGKPGVKVAWATNFEYHDTVMATNEFGYSRWQACVDAWTPSIYQKILQAGKDKSLEQAFQTDIDTIVGLRSAVGKDNRDDVDLMDTWCWGSREKTSFFPSRFNFSSLETSQIMNPAFVWIDGDVIKTRKKIIQFSRLRTPNFTTKKGQPQNINRLLHLKNTVQPAGIIRRGALFTINGNSVVYSVSNEVTYDKPNLKIHTDQSLPEVFEDQIVRFEDDGDQETIDDILDEGKLLEPRRNKRLGGYMLDDNPFFLANPEVQFDGKGNPIPVGT